jgi:hypothetical protein
MEKKETVKTAEVKSDLVKVATAVEQPNAEQLKVQLVREKALRVRQCEQEVMALLVKYNCGLDSAMIVRQGDVRAEIRVIAKE